MHEVAQSFLPSEQFSCNNAGYCVLGRLVEVLMNAPYDVCLRDHLIAPLGLTPASRRSRVPCRRPVLPSPS